MEQEIFDDFSKAIMPAINNIYKFKINENGVAMPPEPEFPDCVVERLNYFMQFKEDGLSFMALMDFVLALDEAKSKKRFYQIYDMEWLPVSEEFMKWCTSFANAEFGQEQIAVAVLYGYVGYIDLNELED